MSSDAGETEKLAMKLKKKDARAAAKLLGKGWKATAQIRVIATDGDGDDTTEKVSVTVKR